MVLDPFCGSGTLLVEAVIRNIRATGLDADPLAAFIADAKLTRVEPKALSSAFESIIRRVERLTAHRHYDRLARRDISARQYEAELEGINFSIPAIPRLHHWFRRYVTIDLAIIKRAILRSRCDEQTKKVAMLCFASIIRGSSNADPVPVSGLEYTAHMRRLDEQGRVVNPLALLKRKFITALAAYSSYFNLTPPTLSYFCKVQDARTLDSSSLIAPPDVIVTSPPYVGAVDYYRRHQLEMYWLDLVSSQKERESLIERYIGRPKVYGATVGVSQIASVTAHGFVEQHLKENPSAMRSLLHYSESMRSVFQRLHVISAPHARAILVVGRGRLRGIPLPIEAIFREAASQYFRLTTVESFVTSNRYMSYSRHNGADIRQELVLCFERV